MKMTNKIRYGLGYELKKIEAKRLNREYFGGKKNGLLQETNDYIAERLLGDDPFSVVRLGITELDWFASWNKAYPLPERFYYIWFRDLFQRQGEKEHFMKLLQEGYGSADVMCCWYSSKGEGELLRKYAPDAYYGPARAVEPYYIESHPWSAALEGKKVLVISPFAQQIQSQYAKRYEIWPNRLLPDFYLKTMRSVWYNTPENPDFATWFDALQFMERQIDKIDFDIALLGCGPFGTPMTAYIKSIGRKAVYIGGALQILFGIKGKRWDGNPGISCFYNDFWVYADESTKPGKADILDDECYW